MSSKSLAGTWANKLLCPLGQEHLYLWLCGLPPWGTCRLPTTSASGFPGGCSPAAGEWPDQTRPGKLSLRGHRRAQNMERECELVYHFAPFPGEPAHSACLTSGGEWQRRKGVSPQKHHSPLGCLRTVGGEEGVWLRAGHSAISTSLLSTLTGMSVSWSRPQCG